MVHINEIENHFHLKLSSAKLKSHKGTGPEKERKGRYLIFFEGKEARYLQYLWWVGSRCVAIVEAILSVNFQQRHGEVAEWSKALAC